MGFNSGFKELTCHRPKCLLLTFNCNTLLTQEIQQRFFNNSIQKIPWMHITYTCNQYLLKYIFGKKFNTNSWFQTFAMFWMLYVFFWVIPRRLNFICRRFRTLCLFHLHRQKGVEWLCLRIVGVFIGKKGFAQNWPEPVEGGWQGRGGSGYRAGRRAKTDMEARGWCA